MIGEHEDSASIDLTQQRELRAGFPLLQDVTYFQTGSRESDLEFGVNST